MLPKRKRITKKDFPVILKKGKTLSDPFFVFRYFHQENPQYSFVVPKNVCKKAIDRNKFKRRGYNFLRFLPVKSSIGIFFYKKQAIKAKPQEIKESIIFLLKKAEII